MILINILVALLFLGFSIWSLIEKQKGLELWIYILNLAFHAISFIFSIIMAICAKKANKIATYFIGVLGTLTSVFYGL